MNTEKVRKFVKFITFIKLVEGDFFIVILSVSVASATESEGSQPGTFYEAIIHVFYFVLAGTPKSRIFSFADIFHKNISLHSVLSSYYYENRYS